MIAVFKSSLFRSIKRPFSPFFITVLGNPILVETVGTEHKEASENSEGPVSLEEAIQTKSTIEYQTLLLVALLWQVL